MTDPIDPYRQPDPTPPWPPAPQPFPPQPFPPQAFPPQAPAPWPPAPQPISGAPATAPLPVPYAPPPASFGGYGAAPTSPGAPYGYDPMTGQPLSDKSKVVAGLLQLLLGFVFALGGVGRLYAGHHGMGVAQIVASVVGWISFWCGFLLFVPWAISAGVWLWFVIDGIMLLAGRPVDGQGRLLRT